MPGIYGVKSQVGHEWIRGGRRRPSGSQRRQSGDQRRQIGGPRRQRLKKKDVETDVVKIEEG